MLEKCLHKVIDWVYFSIHKTKNMSFGILTVRVEHGHKVVELCVGEHVHCCGPV